ncbi:MAG: hypothetical protein QF898_00035, partial [SAR202 cluster bacterium]|nr:hypothetical protein [SAR202 cluster bacterium]
EQINRSVHFAITENLANEQVIDKAQRRVTGALIQWTKFIGVPLVIVLLAVLGYAHIPTMTRANAPLINSRR